jgi:3-methyladenine DNA glycosylase AlkD
MRYKEVVQLLESLSDPTAAAGMQRFGIQTGNAFGVSIPHLRKMAKQIGKDHLLAQRLWTSGIHEARILACMVDDPERVTEKQMERWVKDLDSWDVCDQCCNNLFYKTRWAHQKAVQWSRRNEEFIKRAGFVMMAVLAVHDKEKDDRAFAKFFPMIRKEAIDDRNFVRKAVNWALRQIGKRNLNLNGIAIRTAKKIQEIDSKAAKWIASDALRELTGKAAQKRLHR